MNRIRGCAEGSIEELGFGVSGGLCRQIDVFFIKKDEEGPLY